MKKKIALLVTVLLLVFSVNFVLAAPVETGSVNGYTTRGSVSIGPSSASALTTCGGPGASVNVTVTYWYYDDDTMIFYSSGNGNGGIISTSTTAYRPSGNYISEVAYGSHTVYFGSQKWTAKIIFINCAQREKYDLILSCERKVLI